MAWPKIKNIIILILLGTNLCLLGFTVGRAAYSEQLQDQARLDAISFLKSKGIQLEESLVPESMELMPMRVSRDVAREQNLAKALLEGTVTVQARGAQVFRYYNENGSVQFHSNGEFSAHFSAGAMQAGELTLEEHSRQMMQRLEIQGRVVDSREEDGLWSLSFQESWNGVALLNCQVSLNYQDGALVSMTGGRRLVGQPQEDTASSCITVATALMKFYTGVVELGDACTRISSIEQGYLVTSTISDPIPLTPVWQITTDIRTYQLDLTTGTLSRVL